MFRYAQLLKSNKFVLFMTLTKKIQYIVHGCIFIKISDQFTCVHQGKENSQNINLTKKFLFTLANIIFILVERQIIVFYFAFYLTKIH